MRTMRRDGATGSHRIGRGLAGLTTACALAALAGCSAVDLLDVPDLPESPGVEQQAWPRLIDSPDVAPEVGDGSVAAKVGKGEDIEQSLADERDALKKLDAEMRADPVVTTDLEAEKRRVRAQAAAAAASGG